MSRICAELDGAVAEFRERRLDHIEFPYIFLDATYVKAHEGPSVVSKAIIVATGVAADGNRELLGLAVGDSEDASFWTAFLRSLRTRGLAGGRLVIHDVFLNDALDGPLPIALYSAALFTLTEGRAYSGAEYREWQRAAGLEPGEVVPTLIHCGLLVGVKG